jgi:hypothetical protein
MEGLFSRAAQALSMHEGDEDASTTFMTRVAVLPMDDRPVTYDYPRYLARAAGFEILLPPRDWLGNPFRPSRHADLVGWLTTASREADATVVSIDTLAYGGLIPSRTSPESLDAVLARLRILRDLKTARPDQPILASSVVLRICRNNSSEEEKPYWATFGSRMFRLSYLEHKAEVGDGSPNEIAERDALREQIPNEVYRDYRGGRARNHAVNRHMLDWLSAGVFDYLLFPQDDTADYGWNIAEARALQALIRANRLTRRSITYPGGDEIGCLLLARYACQKAGFAPRVWPRYSGISSSSVVTAYEDRPIHELLKAHLAPLDGTVADSPQEADLNLFVNAPARQQGNGDSQWIIWRGLDVVRAKLPVEFHAWFDEFTSTEGFRATNREMVSPLRSPEEFVSALRLAVDTGRLVAVADVAFVNGSDLILCDNLRQQLQVTAMAAFGGWNTAGNTLGTVLAQAVIRALAMRNGATRDQLAAHFEFLFLRLLDDDQYQARERTRCMVENLPALGIAPTMERLPDAHASAIEDSIRANLSLAAAELRDLFVASGLVRDVKVTHIHLPWQRLFEVGFDVKVDLA